VRVLVVSHLYPAPGYERHLFVHEQVLALRRLGVDVVVCSPTPAAPRLLWFRRRWREMGSRPRQAVRDGVPATYPRALVLPRQTLFSRSGDFFYLGMRAVANALGAFDLIHAHQALPDGAAAQRLAARLGVPYVITVHGGDVYRHLRRGGAVAARTRSALRGAAAVVAVSRRVATLLAREVPPDRLHVCHNGVVGGLERVPPADVLPGRPVLLTVGYLIPRKGHATVLEAVRRVRQHGLDAVWLVVGDGPLRRHLEASAAQQGLAGAVQFLGRRPHEEVLALMARADLFVLPSWDEAFGLVYTEAMTQETPVVACAGEGPEDFIVHGQSGYLVPPRDAPALADVIEAALRDDQARRAIGRAGRQAAAELTWRSNAEAHLELYQAILATPSRLE
jgi:glycosyltransferase involved in cell wall biosynthesis